MSQSDYLKFKRIQTQLKDSSFNPVLSNQDYIDFKQYSIETTVQNTGKLYNELSPSNTNIVFGMNKKLTNCPTFIVCNDTNTRPNRVPMSDMYFTPKYVRSYIKQPTYKKSSCNCILNSAYTNEYLCKCKKSFY
jgi:hypothetical protein